MTKPIHLEKIAQVTTGVSPDLKRTIEQLAKREGQSVRQWVRAAIDARLAREGQG